MISFFRQKPRRKQNILKAFVLVIAIFSAVQPRSAHAIGLLRDAETEWFLNTISAPLFEAAGLAPGAVNMYIVNDNSINAFVAGGQNIFINTGLILKVDNVNQLLAVIAHETGHISGAHLARNSEGGKGATNVMMVSMLLGVAAMLAGSADAGMGMMMGGQTMAQRTYLKYNRVQESAADQAAARLLEATGTSGVGLIETFRMFRDQELLSFRYQDPYARSHPMSGDRIASLERNVERASSFGKPPNPEFEYWFKRVKAKLGGYVHQSAQTFRTYPESDNSLEARYARTYAYHKDLNWDKALSELQSLINDNSADPYFLETAGQIHLENGNLENSLPYYRRAHHMLPENALIMTSLAHALITLNTPENNAEGIRLLEKTVLIEPDNDFAWRQLAIAYAQSDEPEEASLATAELFRLYGRYPESRYHAQIAVDYFPTGSPKWIRAQDILIQTENLMQDDNHRNQRRLSD